jgi:uncharacterized FlaG/YvyC family protein
MDTPAVNSAGIPPVQPSKTQSPSPSSRSEAIQTSEPKTLDDKVDLSSNVQNLLKSKKSSQASTNNEQKKFSITDSNDVVIQVIDPKTHQVVKSIPTEEQIQLKNAIRDGVKDILE